MHLVKSRRMCANNIQSPYIVKEHAIFLLGTMQGGYNIPILINQLKDEEYGYQAVKALTGNILLFDDYYEVEKQYKDGKKAKVFTAVLTYDVFQHILPLISSS